MYINGIVNWGIIGCGDVCEVKSGPAFSKVPGSSLKSVMRRDKAKVEDYARRHKVPNFYTEAALLMEDPDVNAIYIATPPGSHERYAIEAMKAGKPVYIEKPVAVNTKACQNMIAASRQYGIPASVAHYRRELSLFRRVKSLIDQQAIGSVKLVILNLFQSPKPNTDAIENWRVDPALSGGGLFYDLAPHQLDIMYWIFGVPTSTTGHSINQGKNYPAPDVTALTTVFPGGIVLQGLWSFNAPAHARQDTCKIIGEKGTLEFSFFTSFVKSTLEIHRNGATELEEFTFPEHIQQPMIEEVVKYFQGKAENPCSLDDALVTMNMMEQTSPT
jgi:1,5-anhydro-D-fructose reductase (1,5-anhydro-D-mannitol-forming)